MYGAVPMVAMAGRHPNIYWTMGSCKFLIHDASSINDILY